MAATAVRKSGGASFEAQQGSVSGLGRILAILGFSVLVLVAIIQVAPFILTISNSFKCDPAITNAPGAFIPTLSTTSCTTTAVDGTTGRLSSDDQTDGVFFNPSLDGYSTILAGGAQSNNLPRWLLNTAIYSITVMIGRLIFDSMAGYALARLKFPGNRTLFFIVLGVLMIPGVVLLIPRFLMLNQLGLLNSYFGYFVVLAADAFGIILMKQFFEAIPKEVEEAALVDGANRFVTFFRVILPMATPALVALAIFSFQGQWNNFMDALIIVGTNPAMFNLPMGLTVLQGSGQDVQYDLVLAGAVITTLPMAIIFFIFQRYFVEGVNYSGLAGQ
ncbi:MAG: carbohydrate ABC transporter permease [Chloroflexota bacterium]|nr:carbohydrate ABC transporter permease [Chloroflexota bacterium]